MIFEVYGTLKAKFLPKCRVIIELVDNKCYTVLDSELLKMVQVKLWTHLPRADPLPSFPQSVLRLEVSFQYEI
jgi:hypothetical protein